MSTPSEDVHSGASHPAKPISLVAVSGGLSLGGSTSFLLNLGRALKALEIKFLVVGLSEQNDMGEAFEVSGISTRILPRKSLIYEDRTQMAYSLIAAERPSGVLACLGSDSFEVLRLLPRQVTRIGLIQSDDPGPYEMSQSYTPWLDVMVGVSNTIKNRLKEDPRFKNIECEYIPYGIHFRAATAREAHDAHRPIRLIYVGRMVEEQKRISRLVELVKILASRGLRFEFTFAGSGEGLLNAKRELASHDNVHFLGDVPYGSVSKLLAGHDIMTLLSDYEGLPLSLLEAMGEGVVPVVSDLESGIRDIVTKETGIRVPVGNVLAAADSICSLEGDRAKLKAMGSAASHLAREEYSSAKMARRYLDLIQHREGESAEWPEKAVIPVPLMVKHSWMYQGIFRNIRRILKRCV